MNRAYTELFVYSFFSIRLRAPETKALRNLKKVARCWFVKPLLIGLTEITFDHVRSLESIRHI